MKSLLNRKPYNINKKYGKDANLLIIVGASIGVSILLFMFGLLILLGILLSPLELLTGMDFIVFGVLGCIGPIGFYEHVKQKRKKEIGDKLPEFLRDIANSTSSGMTIFDAIKSASEGDYGHLTPELKIVVAQLSWGIPIKEALLNFADRVNTNELRRLAITVNKALEIGGNTASVFNAAAKEIDQIIRVEQQRKTEMSMYSIVIFISFFVFLAVIIIINSTIFNAIYELQGKVPAGGQFSFSDVDPSSVKNMFFTFVFVQSLGGGLLGGYMTEGRLSSGVRYGFVLVLASFITFKIMF